MSLLKDPDMRYGFAVMKAMRAWRAAGSPTVARREGALLPGYRECGTCGLRPLECFSPSGVRNKRCRLCVKVHNAEYNDRMSTAAAAACPSAPE